MIPSNRTTTRTVSFVHSKRSKSRGFTKSDTVRVEEAEIASINQRYEILRELGRGAYGQVVHVRCRQSNLERVVKSMKFQGLCEEEVDLMKAEAELLQELDHPHVVQLYEGIHDTKKDEFLLVMELVPAGDCGSFLEKQHPIDENFVAQMIQQLLVATEYCHNKGILHRDIKPENMMLTSTNSRQCQVKVIDFGVCKILEKAHSRVKNEGFAVGTLPYIAPEILRECGFDEKCDLYSIGVTAYKMLGNKYPLATKDCASMQDFVEALVMCNMESLPEGRSPAAREFCKALLHPDPQLRWSCKKALGSPWLELQESSEEPGGVTRRNTESMVDFASSSLFERACCLLIATRLSSLELHEMSQTFKALDQNCEGRISTSVLQEALLSQLSFTERAYCALFSNARLDAVAKQVDLDGDGYVEFSEFVAASIFSQLNSSDICRHAFDAFDLNGKGTIRFAEVAMCFAKPHLKEFEKQKGVDFLDLIRPVFQGCSEVSYKEFKQLLGGNSFDQEKPRRQKRMPTQKFRTLMASKKSNGLTTCCTTRIRDEV